ncbi:MAG: TMEM165/GDT1 family protein [Candidatus Nanopelagicales bacterium]|nr:TMEM165/GDT1 family protein [Candidatus Nanopelagicales bacterium]
MWGLDLAVVVSTFPVIFLAELPDKTFVAALVLATRFRHLLVWIGVSAAFFVQCLIAVVAGSFISLLPAALVLGVTGAFFVVGAVILIRSGLRTRSEEAQVEHDEESEVLAKVGDTTSASAVKVLATSFIVLFAAEWGDLTQIFTAAQAAKTGAPLSVFIGSWFALIAVSGLAVVLGRWLQQRIPLWRVSIASGTVLLLLAGYTGYEFIQAL